MKKIIFICIVLTMELFSQSGYTVELKKIYCDWVDTKNQIDSVETVIRNSSGGIITPSTDFYYEYHAFTDGAPDTLGGLGQNKCFLDNDANQTQEWYVIVIDSANFTFCDTSDTVTFRMQDENNSALKFRFEAKNGTTTLADVKIDHWMYVVDLWNIHFSDYINHYLTQYHDETLRANPFFVSNSNDKFNYWNSDQSLALNHNRFSIESSIDTNWVAHYKDSYDGIIVQYNFDGNNGDSLEFKDPWLLDYNDSIKGMRNQGMDAPFKKVGSPFNPDFNSDYKGVFLDQTINSGVYYSISIPSSITHPQTGRTHDLYLLNYSTTNASLQNAGSFTTGVVFTGDNANITANLKGSQLSDTTTAIAGNGQRKIVKTGEGTMHMVYESMGHVWYERSTDNGANWSLIARTPLDSINGKCPTIDYLNYRHPGTNYNTYYVVISFQDKYNSNYRLKSVIYKYTDDPGLWEPLQDSYVFTSSESYSGHDAKPCIAIDSSTARVTMVWEYNYGSGLYYSKAYLGSSGLYSVTSGAKISGTTSSSHNPTISASKISGGSSLHHICWDDNNTIYYTNYNGSSFSTFQNISSGKGYGYNNNPSVIAISDGSCRIVWMGKYTSTSQYAIIFKDPGYYYYWTFHHSSYDALYPNYVLSDRSTGYAFAWSEGGLGYFGYQNLSTVIPIENPDTSATMPGQYFQICNGPTKNDMYAIALNQNSSPLYFDISDNLGALGMVKATNKTTKDVIGRSIIAEKGNLHYIFDMEYIKADDQYVSFPTIPENDRSSIEESMAKYLSSNIFQITDDSKIKYSVYYGSTDDNTGNWFTKDENLTFGLELVDAATNQVIGSCNEVKYDKTTNSNFQAKLYSFDTKGLGNKSVFLRMRVNKNFEGAYSIGSSVKSVTDYDLNKSAVENILLNKNNIATTYELGQNYPNPFNPTTIIKYQMPEAGNVTLKIYDILGREVKTLVDEFKDKGSYNVIFDGSNLASGIYIYTLNVNNFTMTKKLLLMK